MAQPQYTDTFILEANRRHSAQFLLDQPNETEATGNWVNDVNDGIHLNVGDQVSVHSAMVSDLGAEDATIEFKGKEIAPIGVQTYVESVPSYPDDINASTGVDERIEIQPAEHPTEVYTETTTKNILPLKDNEATIAMNFYKNTNAEYHITLPQQWSNEDAKPLVGFNIDTGRGNLATPQPVVSATTGYGQVAVSPGSDIRCSADWNSYGGIEIATFDRGNSGAGTGGPRNANFKNTQLKIDNSRYQLFVRKKTYRYKTASDPTENSNKKLIDLAVRDPALADYIPFQQLLKIDIPLGFNSPSEVASVITERMNQLRDTGPVTLRYESDGLRVPTIPAGTPVAEVISQKQESNSIRLINCATPFTNSQLNASAYLGNLKTPSNASFDPVANYLSSYQFVGFKRPDFVQKGRILAKLSPSTYKVGNASFDEMRSCLDDSGMILGELGENPGFRQNAYTYDYVPIVTNIEYTQENLEKYMDWFQTQGNYPELFELDNNNVYKFVNKGNGGTAHQYKGNGDDITIDTHRFVHMNTRDNTAPGSEPFRVCPFQNVAVNPAAVPDPIVYPDRDGTENGAAFGWDGYQTSYTYTTGTSLLDYTSAPLFIKFNKDEVNNRNFYRDGNFRFDQAPPGNKQLYGGIMMRGLKRSTGLYDRIAFLAQVPEQYCNLTDAAGTTLVDYPANAHSKWIAGWTGNYSNRKIGYDKHFSAYGNAAIIPFSGYAAEQDHGRTGLCQRVLQVKHLTTAAEKQYIYYTKFLNQIYVGANAPLFNFNSTKSRFEISDLHTPERIGNQAGVGFTNKDSTYVGIPATETLGQAVYQINKRPDGVTFCPNCVPYSGINLQFLGNPGSPFYGEAVRLSPNFHPSMEKYKVFDAHSGILINNWGIPKRNWADSLWGIMGFSYRQLNPQDDGIIGNINQRITSTTDNDIAFITTNCDFIASDMMGNSVNVVSNNLYKPTYISPPLMLMNACSASPITNYVNPPLIVGVADSATITALSLPTKTIRPYYTIRSDILTDSYYFGSKDQLSLAPVIAIVDKMNQYGDFFYAQSSELVFTITNPITITSIKTQVCDPDGDLAQISPNSVVMYKITKKNTARSDIAAQIQQAKLENKK